MAQTRKNRLTRNKLAKKIDKLSNPSPAAVRKCEKKKALFLSNAGYNKMRKDITKKTKAKLAAMKVKMSNSELKPILNKVIATTRKVFTSMNCKKPLSSIGNMMKGLTRRG